MVDGVILAAGLMMICHGRIAVGLFVLTVVPVVVVTEEVTDIVVVVLIIIVLVDGDRK